jgi:hypothetical protein
LPYDETLESKDVPRSGRRDSYSRARGEDMITDDREDGGGAVDMADTAHEEDVDPPGLVCKIIVLMCGIATFARTECILLQTVLFAECELPLFFVRSCACAHVISRGCVRCPGMHVISRGCVRCPGMHVISRGCVRCPGMHERHACAVPDTAITKWTHALNLILLVLALTRRHARIVAYFSHSEHVLRVCFFLFDFFCATACVS